MESIKDGELPLVSRCDESYKFKEGISQRVGFRNGLYNRGKHAALLD